ncbi:MAG: flagellar basal-body MS-ring/collar protein FliF [Gammaproteobacteria bacterium]
MPDTEMGPLTVLKKVPGLSQLLMLIGLALSISLGVMAAFWANEPAYSLLYANISDQDASEIVDVLAGSEIPHRLDRKSGAVLVPDDRLHDARLKLAAQGLPRGGGFGLEILEGDAGFSTSQFMENARYHHALETELAKTISKLRPVQSARIHLALPKNTVFLRKQKQPSASVLVYLFPGRSLEKPQIESIVNLVASSVPELQSSAVTVVDQHGRLLKSPGDDTAMTLTTTQFDYVERLEASYTDRIINILTPFLGPERVRATVTAKVDFTQREETREQFDPANAAVRSEQVVRDRTEGASFANGGIPGALSNQPPVDVPAAADEGTQSAAGSSGPRSSSTQETRNFELDRTLSRTQRPAADIDTLSIAVVVDYKPTVDDEGVATTAPLSDAELAKVRELVQSAVGFSAERGDSLSVSNISFLAQPEPPEMDGPGIFDRPGMRDMLKTIVGGLLLLFIGFRVVRPIVASLSKGLTSQPTSSGVTETAMGPLSYDDKVSIARQLADKNPERVALVVRQWVSEDS